jgi:small subunit ribosomal protein S4
MPAIRKPKGKIVRYLGVNVFGSPKFDKLLKKKPNPPGKERRQKVRPKAQRQSEYGKQLIEKQKLRYSYGLSERQFRNLFMKAKRMEGITGDSVLNLLERRLDNIVYRLGMASTREQARQIVNHNHIKVNGKPVNIPSYTVKSFDTIEVKNRKKSEDLIRKNLSENTQRRVPLWLELSETGFAGKVLRYPIRDEVPTLADVTMVVEFYAKT